jgi:predicted enzyme related to lactoylglutathione lyase
MVEKKSCEDIKDAKEFCQQVFCWALQVMNSFKKTKEK